VAIPCEKRGEGPPFGRKKNDEGGEGGMFCVKGPTCLGRGSSTIQVAKKSSPGSLKKKGNVQNRGRLSRE